MGRYLPKLNKTVIITSLLLLYFDMYFLLGVFFLFSLILFLILLNFVFHFMYYVQRCEIMYIYNIYATYIM